VEDLLIKKVLPMRTRNTRGQMKEIYPWPEGKVHASRCCCQVSCNYCQLL